MGCPFPWLRGCNQDAGRAIMVKRRRTMATKDKAGNKSRKKPPQKGIKEKRQSKRSKRAASGK